MILRQFGLLPINRQVLLILVDQQFNDHFVGQLAFGHDLVGQRRTGHALFFQTMRAAFLSFDHPHKEFGRFARQFFAGLVADHRPLGSAPGTLAIFGPTGQDHFPPFQMRRQRFAARMMGPGNFGFGGGLLGRRQLRFPVHLGRRQTDLGQQKLLLRRGKLVTLGPEHLKVQQPDLLVFEFQDAAQPGILRLQAFNGLAGGGGQGFERNHVMRISYTHN